jgi:polysaccharide pyruvyl transferase WcaK-like protein
VASGVTTIPSSTMRIILETALNKGPAEYQNMGDVSMLQVAARRLRRLWPDASIEVLTDSPKNLQLFCPGTKPLSRVGRDHWVGDGFAFGRFHRYLPEWATSAWRAVSELFERRLPVVLKMIVRLRLGLRDNEHNRGGVVAFLEAMENANLLVVCGAGGFADSCREWNLTTLSTMETAIRRKVPTVMLGQGMGPLTDTDVLARARRVLPAVDLITLRGTLDSPALIEALGVVQSRVKTTGDEAIELAYDARPATLGHALGINLRVASYAEVEGGMTKKLGPVLQDFARRHHAPILPVPIAFHAWASDHLAIRRLLAGFDDQSDGGLALDTPLKVIEQAGRCRVVVTGAYHAAVFSLAQGIPVVCLAKSPYYVAKFLGLAHQFGLGCETILLDDSDMLTKLRTSLERAWNSAETVRNPLQQAALRQINLSRGAYERVRDLLQFR